MKQRSRAYKTYPDWRQREMRMLLWAVAAGSLAAIAIGLAIWLVSRHAY